MLQLKDKVGRFATTGRSCQNWKKDQELVISLLNKIAISDGGAENTLKPQMVVTGYASDGLYNSILYFQKKNFPGTPDGYVRPAGRHSVGSLNCRRRRLPSPPCQRANGTQSRLLPSMLHFAKASSTIQSWTTQRSLTSSGLPSQTAWSPHSSWTT